MEVAFELIRTCISTLSRRCSNYMISTAISKPRLRRKIQLVGHKTHSTYISLKYFGRFWISSSMMSFSGKNRCLENESSDLKITANVKPLDDETALQVGAEVLGDVIVLSIMIILLLLGLNLRYSRLAEAKRLAIQKEMEQENRIEELELKVNELEALTRLIPKAP